MPVIAKSPHWACSRALKLNCGNEDSPIDQWWNVTIPPEPESSSPLSSIDEKFARKKRQIGSPQKQQKTANTLQISGNLRWASGSYYTALQYSNHTADTIAVTGTADLTGAGTVFPTSYGTADSTPITILTDSGLTGNFSSSVDHYMLYANGNSDTIEFIR